MSFLPVRQSFSKVIRAGTICMLLLLAAPGAYAQRFLSEYDSTLFLRDTLMDVVNRFENLHFSGYIQSQFQVALRKGIDSYEGGNFSEHAGTRFQIRRARIKMDYQAPRRGKPLPLAVFTFQMDVNERGTTVRDMFARVYEPGRQNLSFTLGLFARPFGYEVNLSSAWRESPERARASQILMPSERDLGAMISYDPVRRRGGRKPALRWDVGLFNGQGISAPTDFDSFKDIISRLTLKPWKLSNQLTVTGGLSLLYGGWRQNTAYRWEMEGGKDRFRLDSSHRAGTRAPRRYFGTDLQLSWKTGLGSTELRGEYWHGLQPGTDSTTVNPMVQPPGPTWVRPFNAGIFYFIQQLGSEKWELGLKYDWYDPNRQAGGRAIGAQAGNLTPADVRFDTWGGGLTFSPNRHLKILAWYSRVINEATLLPGWERDLSDDVFTLRMQVRF